MAIRAVLLDVGGVLEITPSTGWQARWEERLALPYGTIDEQLAEVYRDGTVGRVTLLEAERRIANLLDLEPEQLEALMADLWTEYLGSLDVRLHAWFRALRPRYKTGIISNSWVGAREREDARWAFGSLCDTIVYSHEEGIAKPDARIYEIACERLGIRPDEAIFLDDLRANVEGARAVGMRAVLFTGETAETIAELNALLGP